MVQSVEIIPAPAVQPWVECLWSIRGDSTGDPAPVKQVLPDGTVEILFRLEGDATVAVGDRGDRLPEVGVVGQLRSPLGIRLAGTLDLVGVRCRPIGAAAILGVPMHELTDKVTPLDAIVADLPINRLAGTTDVNERLAVIHTWVHTRLANASRQCPVRGATEAVLASRGRATVAQLAGATGLSERQLERRFKMLVGVSPKSLARVTRFACAFGYAQSTSTPNWAEIAQRTGYFDQAHLCRDFSLLAGCSPGQVQCDPTVDRWCSELDSRRFFGEMSGFSNTRVLRCA